MKTKAHPYEEFDRNRVAAAEKFNVHMRLGPFDKINQAASSLAEAIHHADNISANHGGKECIIYAITHDGMTVHVDRANIAAERINIEAAAL